MAGKTSGIVTVLFTDQVESTAISQRLGDDAAHVLRRAHFTLLREAVALHRGEEVKTIGDGLMVTFPSAVDAVACGVAMQQAVHRHNARADAPHRLRVRVGLHVGEPIPDEDDYFGTAVVVANRLCDSAEGGQVVASELVRGLVGSRGGFTFGELGARALKGLAEPVTAFEVAWEPAEEPRSSPAPAAEQTSAPALPSWLVPDDRTSFVDREQEWPRLRDCWERARRGRRQVALIEGEPGIGKTRLAGEVALAARAEGAILLAGRSDADAVQPYPALAAALRQLARGSGSQLSSVARDIAERLSRQDHDPRQICDETASVLSAAAQAAPVMLVVDDLHASNGMELSLLKRLVRALDELPVCIICTYRGALARSHPLAPVLTDLRRQGAFERIAVRGMQEEAVGALIGAWSGSEAPPAFTRAVHGRTDGNPFFVEEVLSHLAETDAIYEHEGRLASALAIEEIAIPEGVKEIIVQRLSLLPDECNRVLSAASVIGGEFDLAALERASGVPADRLAELLDEAVLAGVIVEARDAEDCYAFAHALLRETLYEGLTAARRARLHRQTLRYATSGDVQIAYEVLGTAGPFLVATGISNCPAARMRSRTATARWERISRSCRVVLYDRRGVGSSDATEHGYSVRASVADLRAVLDAAGATRALLWGATDGGPLALAFATIYPERVAGLILAGTSARLMNADDWTLGINPEAMASFFRVESVDQGRAVSQLTRVRRTGDAEANAIVKVMQRVRPEVWTKLRGFIGAADVRGLLPQVRAPVLILHDPGNDYIPFEAARYLHEHLAGSRLEISHELPAPLFGDKLYAAVEQFIDEVTAASAR